MLKIIISILTLVVLSLADGPVLQTGQTLSYDAQGNIVALGEIRDDGYYLSGSDRNYTRSVAGVVTDHTTGLEWQDDYSNNGGDIVQKAWVTQANYDDGNYSDTLGDTAATYCSELGLDGGEWRLPSRKELSGLIDYGNSSPAIDFIAFTQVTSSYYWSSTTSASSTSSAWNVNFSGGSQYYYSKTSSYYVRCVRSGQLEPSTFERDNVKEIVADTTTGLQWQDNSVGYGMYWSSAIGYCEGLTLGAYSDWRLPNINELNSIIDYTSYDPAIDGIFLNATSGGYWSSTTYAGNTSRAWFVHFVSGYQHDNGKSNNVYVRCVRSGQNELSPCSKEQGTDTCITRESKPNPGIYLPSCETGRLVQGQGTESCDDTLDPVDPFTLPTCDGERLVQGTNQCGTNTAPEWTQTSYDTGLTIEDSTDDPQTIIDLEAVCTDAEGDAITYSILSISVPDAAEQSRWDNSVYLDEGVLKVHNLMTIDPNIDGTVTVTVKAEATGGSSNTDVTFIFKDTQ